MPKFKNVSGADIEVGGEVHGPGFVFEATPELVADHFSVGAIQDVEDDVADDDEDDFDPTRIGAIQAKFVDLTPADMTKSGVPDVKALEKLLGHDITAAERDHAWATREQPGQ